jgi:hypothetical protein
MVILLLVKKGPPSAIGCSRRYKPGGGQGDDDDASEGEIKVHGGTPWAVGRGDGAAAAGLKMLPPEFPQAPGGWPLTFFGRRLCRHMNGNGCSLGRRT